MDRIEINDFVSDPLRSLAENIGDQIAVSRPSGHIIAVVGVSVTSELQRYIADAERADDEDDEDERGATASELVRRSAWLA